MDKFKGLDKDGGVIVEKCVTHNYYDLPMQGFSRSFDSVGMNEPVLIKHSEMLSMHIYAHILNDAFQGRASELNANINWMRVPPDHLHDEDVYKVWFSPKK